MTLSSVLFALGASLVSAWYQGMTTDEPIHLEWSRRLLENGVTERESFQHFDSKTPITMLNVAARKLAKRRLGVADPRALLFCARLPTVAAFMGLLGTVFLVTRAWLGVRTAHLATLATALDPSLIAHGCLATVDVPYALANLLALAAAYTFVRRPSLRGGVVLGLTLGLAFSIKFTALFLLPLFALSPLALDESTSWSPRGFRVALLALLLAAATCLLVLCAAYLFGQVGLPLSRIPFKSAPFLRLAALLPGLRLPLPADFLTGLDLSLADERNADWKVVILGLRRPEGVWFYFPLLWLLKTPLLILIAQVVGLYRVVRMRILFANPALRFLTACLLVYLGYFSFLFRTQLGYRFVLMCVPLGYVIAAAGLESVRLGKWTTPVGLTVVVAALAENSAYLGNHLAFTNAAVQPKERVFRLITDSNVDWAQNYDKVESYLARAGVSRSRLDPPHVLPGRNLLRFELASGSLRFERHQWLRENVEPVAHFDHTYLLFEIDDAQFERFLNETRRLAPSVQGAARCAGADDAHVLASGEPLSVPRRGREAKPLLFCVSTPEGADVVLAGASGSILVSRSDNPRAEWDFIQPGQVVWYRLEPGVHALPARVAEDFAGSWSVSRGAATFRVVRPPRQR